MYRGLEAYRKGLSTLPLSIHPSSEASVFTCSFLPLFISLPFLLLYATVLEPVGSPGKLAFFQQAKKNGGIDALELFDTIMKSKAFGVRCVCTRVCVNICMHAEVHICCPIQCIYPLLCLTQSLTHSSMHTHTHTQPHPLHFF
jgi:hypothetical protein